MVLKAVNSSAPFDLTDFGAQYVDFPRSVVAITDGDTVFVNSSGWINRAVASASSTMRSIGVAARSGALSGLAVRVVLGGMFHSPQYNYSGYIGLDVYAPLAAGPPSVVQPSASGQISQVVGRAVDGSGIVVQVETTIQRGGVL